jgi:hypothetical protein
MMKYKITTSYNWYDTEYEKFIIKTFYINHIPFTFDEIPKLIQDDPEIIKQANENRLMSPQIFYQTSFYLIDEEAHPMLFELDLENPESLKELND